MSWEGPKKFRLDPEAPPAEAAVHALADTLGYAHVRIVTRHDDPTTAVHEYRKALRRARSLIRLLRPVLSKSAQRRLGVPLKVAHHATSAARDRDVVLAIARDIDTAAARALSDALATSRPPVKGWPDSLSDLPDRLRDALATTELRRRDLLEGTRRLYRDARRVLARVHRVPDPVHVHALRKRTKDVVGALYLLSAIEPRLESRHEKFAELARSLGEVTDLYLLREAVIEHRDLLGDREQDWLASLARQIKSKRKAAVKRADRLYRRKSKKWKKRLR